MNHELTTEGLRKPLQCHCERSEAIPLHCLEIASAQRARLAMTGYFSHGRGLRLPAPSISTIIRGTNMRGDNTLYILPLSPPRSAIRTTKRAGTIGGLPNT